MNLIGKLGGRKFLTALLSTIAIALSSAFGINEQSLLLMGGVAITYIMSQGFADGMSGGATSSTPPVVDPQSDN